MTLFVHLIITMTNLNVIWCSFFSNYYYYYHHCTNYKNDSCKKSLNSWKVFSRSLFLSSFIKICIVFNFIIKKKRRKKTSDFVLKVDVDRARITLIRKNLLNGFFPPHLIHKANSSIISQLERNDEIKGILFIAHQDCCNNFNKELTKKQRNAVCR